VSAELFRVSTNKFSTSKTVVFETPRDRRVNADSMA
jgi:hypothetical protein